jgi:hypothetical protein
MPCGELELLMALQRRGELVPNLEMGMLRVVVMEEPL